eukprot:symbB.v1.2.029227.t1/scaffold3174.1/size61966/3
MPGQTNCWILPSGQYGCFEAPENQVYVTSHRAARNMSFQDILMPWGKPKCVMEISGQELLGKKVVAPTTKYKYVHILPLPTIKMDKGTGVVTSVPSDSPDDYAAYMDLMKSDKKREFYGVKKEWVDGFELIPIIDVEIDGEVRSMAAEYVCEKLGVQSINDRVKLAEAHDTCYKLGFDKGIMSLGPFKGQPVKKAKPKITWQVGYSCVGPVHPLMAFELQEVVERRADSPPLMAFELQELAERRAKEAKELHGCARLWSIYFFTWLDVWSHLAVVFAAWWSTAYILVPYFAVHFAMAASRSGARQAIKAPLTWLVPEGGSTVGTSGCYPWVFYAVSYALRGGCSIPLALKIIDTYAFSIGAFDILGSYRLPYTGISNSLNGPRDCEGLPFWLRRPWWSSEATCTVTASSYHRCFEKLFWWQEGFCNFYAAQQGTTFYFSLGWASKLANGVTFSPVCALVLALLAWTLWALGRCLVCCWFCLCPDKAVPVEESRHMLPVDHQMKLREPPWKLLSQAKVAKDVIFFCLDLLFDLNGIVAFVWTGNFCFAAFSAVAFALSLGQQLATDGFGSFYQEARESLSEGRLTDGLRRLTLTEKSVEAPLQLLVQFFSFMYVSSSDYALVSFAVSMLLSLYSVVDAAYMLMELNLLPSLQEVSVSSNGMPLIQ